MESTQNKLINNIDLVVKFRKILFFQMFVPLPLYLIFLFLNYTIIKVIKNAFLSTTLIFIPLIIVIGVAVIFTPYLFYVLIKEKRYSWMIAFFFMIAVPYIIILLVFFDFVLLSAWLILPIILYYFYCFLIKYSVDDWLKEYYAHEAYEEQKKESAKRKQDELLWG